MATFNYTYNPLSYEDAQKQSAQQIDPLYNRAIQNVNQQKYQNDVQSGQLAASRGLGHSGLAADLINKNAIAAQGQIGDISAQRATQLAQMATDMVNQDKNFGLQSRSQSYNEWLGQQNLANNERDFNYQQSRDKVADTQWQTQFDYSKGRDQVSDQRYNQEWQNTLSQQNLAEQWKQREWNDMSPADKARMALQYEYSKKSSGGGGGGSKGKTTSVPSKMVSTVTNYAQSTQPQTAIDRYYSSPVIQQVEAIKAKNPLYNNVLKAPVAPAQNKNLTAWDKMKLFGM